LGHEDIPPCRSVHATGGGLTMTALNYAIEIIEKEGGTIEEIALGTWAAVEFCKLRGWPIRPSIDDLAHVTEKPSRIKMLPIRFGIATNELGEVVSDSYKTPERDFVARLEKSLPDNVVVIYPKSSVGFSRRSIGPFYGGTPTKVVITSERE